MARQPKEGRGKKPPAAAPPPAPIAAPLVGADLEAIRWALRPALPEPDPESPLPLMPRFKVRECSAIEIADIVVDPLGEVLHEQYVKEFAPWTTAEDLYAAIGAKPLQLVFYGPADEKNARKEIGARELNLADMPPPQVDAATLAAAEHAQASAPAPSYGVSANARNAKGARKVEAGSTNATLALLKIDNEIIVPGDLSPAERLEFVMRQKIRRELYNEIRPLIESAFRQAEMSSLVTSEGAKSVMKYASDMISRAQALEMDLTRERAHKVTMEMLHTQEVIRLGSFGETQRRTLSAEVDDLRKQLRDGRDEFAALKREYSNLEMQVNSYEKLAWEAANTYGMGAIQMIAKKFGIEPAKIMAHGDKPGGTS